MVMLRSGKAFIRIACPLLPTFCIDLRILDLLRGQSDIRNFGSNPRVPLFFNWISVYLLPSLCRMEAGVNNQERASALSRQRLSPGVTNTQAL
jgi:hypothetical protein